MGRERPQPSHHGSPHTAVISHRVEMEAQRASLAQVTPLWNQNLDTLKAPVLSLRVPHECGRMVPLPFLKPGAQATSQAAETRERRAPKPREVR